MEVVHLDLKKYLNRNIFPSRTVLVFPPFNGFRRFLIHKLIEDNFASAGVAAFSIGQDVSRRIVVCYKGLIRNPQEKGIPVPLSKKSGFSMIEKSQSKQKLTPSAAVYRPPAARIAESRRSIDDTKPDTKRSRARRPDQQMYVPRPKRASYSNEQPRSRSHSSSRTSLESDSSDKKNIMSIHKSEDHSNKRLNDHRTEKDEVRTVTNLSNSLEKISNPGDIVPSYNSDISADVEIKDVLGAESVTSLNTDRHPDIVPEDDLGPSQDIPGRLPSKVARTESPELPACEQALDVGTDQLNQINCNPTNTESIATKTSDEMHIESYSVANITNNEKQGIYSNKNGSHYFKEKSNLNIIKNSVEDGKMDTVEKDLNPKTEAMETISISSESRDDQISSSSTSTSVSNHFKNSETSSDSETMQRHCERKNFEKMEVEHSIDLKNKKKISNQDNINSHEQNLKNRKISPNFPVSEVLIISDTSSDDNSNISRENEPKVEISKNKGRKHSISKDNANEKLINKSKLINPNDCDWESMYDDNGECLVPDLMEELTNSVGQVRVTPADSDYRPYQSIEERTNDGECVIEIYDFPAEFKTTDLFKVFAAYRNKNFQIKWVDDTHALGIFPSPFMADEVLACTLPFVKTRPLRLGIAESRNKARNLVLPPLPSMERPKTCPALARRLVSGALGLRLPTSSQEREKEKRVLKEAREKRRLEAKQREAAWDGTITSSSCI